MSFSGIAKRSVRVISVASLVMVATLSATAASSVSAADGPSVSAHGITVNPHVELTDGVIHGRLRARSRSGAALKYEFLSSSKKGKLILGNAPGASDTADPQSFTILPYATWLDGDNSDTQTFRVRVSEVADPSKSVTATISVGLGPEPSELPASFTYKVQTFSGVKISTNFFRAAGLTPGDTAPTILDAPMFAAPGSTDVYSLLDENPFVADIKTLRDSGYNVVTWDARGTFSSGGLMHFSNPFLEGRDVSSLIDWVATSTPATLDGTNDPKIGMLGGNYGGAIQIVAAGTEPRIDAIVPTATWSSLVSAFNPNGIFKTSVVDTLMHRLREIHARVSKHYRIGLRAAIETGTLDGATRSLLAASGPTSLMHQLQAPVLLVQDIADPMFGLDESLDSAQTIIGNPYGVPVKMIWYDSESDDDSQMTEISDDTLKWFDQYVGGVGGNPANSIPNFQWPGRSGAFLISSQFPWSDGFNSPTPIEGTKESGSLTFASVASAPISMVKVPVTFVPSNVVAGSPAITFTYEGTGDAKSVFVRIIDKSNGKAISAYDTPVPVLLDANSHTVSVAISAIAWEAAASGSSQVEVQIRSASNGFARIGSGSISLTDIQVDFPVTS